MMVFAASCVVLPGLFFLCYRHRKRPEYFRYIVWAILCIGWAAVAGLRYHQVYYRYPENHIVQYCDPSQGRLASVRGVIVTEPYAAKSQGFFANFDRIHQARSVFVLRCDEVLTNLADTPWQKVTGLAQVNVSPPYLQLQQGQRIQLDCWMSLRGTSNNPGEFDGTDYYRGNRNLITLGVEQPEAVTILSSRSGGNFFYRVQHYLQKRLSATLTDGFLSAADSDVAALMSALLLGLRYDISDQLNELFAKSGTMHFLSLSGLHVGILIAFVWAIAGALRLSRHTQGIITLCFVLMMILVVPQQAPATRAEILCIIFCIGYTAGYRTNFLNSLAAGAIFILLWKPVELFTAGFELSFVAVLGLGCFVNPLLNSRRYDEFGDLDNNQFQRKSLSPYQYIKQQSITYIKGLLAVSLVAWLSGMPLAAYHFHRIALWGAPISAILLPPMTLILLVGLVKIVLAMVMPMPALPLDWPLTQLSHAAIFIVEKGANLPYSNINTGSPPLWLIAIFYGLLICAAWLLQHGRRLNRRLMAALAVWTIIFIWMLPFSPVPKGTSLDMLDIGHGAATVLRLPDKKVICYDIGSLSNFNLAERTVTPFLRSRGINHIEAIFISHANIDHYNGVIDICRNFDVGTVYISSHFQHTADGSAKVLLNTLEKMQQPVVPISPGEILHNGKPGDDKYYQIEVLAPADELIGQLEANDTSLVLRITDRNGTILLCGDIESAGQQFLMTSVPKEKLQADVLQLPHHGGLADTLAEFIKRVNPKVCIGSCGLAVETSIQTIQQYAPQAKIMYTPESGAINVRLTADGVKTDSFHKTAAAAK
jgi:competence protein ComEC